MNLYERIKRTAKTQGKSINRLEQDLGFPRSSVSKFVTNTPSVDKVETIADYLDVSIDTLVKGKKVKEDVTSEIVDINEVLDSLLQSLDDGTGLYPSGSTPSSDAEKEALANSIKMVMATVDAFDEK